MGVNGACFLHLVGDDAADEVWVSATKSDHQVVQGLLLGGGGKGGGEERGERRGVGGGEAKEERKGRGGGKGEEVKEKQQLAQVCLHARLPLNGPHAHTLCLWPTVMN